MKEQDYYDLMENMGDDFETIHANWKKCFAHILNELSTFTPESIESLFYHFDMDNWPALHQENTEYKDMSKEQLSDAFKGQCWYISDRISYDRLFRTHWLFRQAFKEELRNFIYER